MSAGNKNGKSGKKQKNRMHHNDSVGLQELRDQAVTVGEDVRGLARTAGQAAIDQMDPVESYIREKPLKSVLIAAGVGALLGAFYLRR